MKQIFALLSGLVFGIGLIVSGMADPAKVLNFLDVFGTWDPSLAFVMGGAIAVTAPLAELEDPGRAVCCIGPSRDFVAWSIRKGNGSTVANRVLGAVAFVCCSFSHYPRPRMCAQGYAA